MKVRKAKMIEQKKKPDAALIALLKEAVLKMDKKGQIYWEDLHNSNRFPEWFMREFIEKLCFEDLLWEQKIPDSLLREFQSKFGTYEWRAVAQYQSLSEQFIRDFEDKLCFDLVFACQDISKEFFIEFKHKITNWRDFRPYSEFPECIILENRLKISNHSRRDFWRHICGNQQLSEHLIREFKDYLPWDVICRCQKLSEEFIMEFKHQVDWFNVFLYQDLTENIVKEYINITNLEEGNI